MCPSCTCVQEFVQGLKEVNTELVANAAKLSKGGAQAITSKVHTYIHIDTYIILVTFAKFGILQKLDALILLSPISQFFILLPHSQAWDKYLTIDVNAHAPVLILPVSEDSAQAFMVDLGSISVRNMLLPLDEGAGVEAYGINLDSLKASR